MRKSFLLLLVLVPLFPLLALPRQNISLSVYNQNFALVREVRTIPLVKGINRIEFGEVPSLLEPESVYLESLDKRFPLFLREQTYRFDVLNPGRLLEKYLGKEITIRGEGDTLIRGRLLSLEGDYFILEREKRKLVMIRKDEVVTVEFPSLPEELQTRPVLVWVLESKRRGKVKVAVSYITRGINWSANYNCFLDQREKNLEFTGWVNIDNRSGVSYPSATLKLIAGEVHRVEKRRGIMPQMMRQMMRETPSPQFEQKPLFEYYLYRLKGKIDIPDKTEKQVEFVRAEKVKVKREYEFDSARDPKNVFTYVTFLNSPSNQLGYPLPAGRVRIYRKSEEGWEFIGEDNIQHTPREEKVRLFVGKAFDLVGERKVLKREKVGARKWEIQVRVILRNRKEEGSALIKVRERFPGDWEIITSSHSWERIDARTAVFPVELKAGEKVTLEYTASYQW